MFPHYCHPNNKIFATVDHPLRGTGTLKPLVVNWGREAGFDLDGIINFLNHHQWAQDNPLGVLQKSSSSSALRF
jgi:hypothetical protein